MRFWDTVLDSPVDDAYGKRLIPVIIDEVAVKDPERVCFSFPRAYNLQDGFQNMTFRIFANAVNKTAHFIRQEIGCSSMFETVLYLGYPDVRHFIALVALIKTGHKILLSSHRNSVAGHVDLAKQTDCGIMLYTSGFPVSSILDHCRMESICMPELGYLLDDTPCLLYPFDKTFEEAKDQPCMIMQTASSTGLPKPIVWTHWTFSMTDSQHRVSPLHERPSLWGEVVLQPSGRNFNALPIFHGAGIAMGISQACFTDSVVVLGPPGLATADVFLDVMKYAGIDSASCVPVTLEEIATRPDVLEKLRKLRYITYVGGLLSETAGDIISRYVPLYSIIASAESCIATQHVTDPEDWQYVCLNPDVDGIDMRPHGNLHELVFVKNTKRADYQGVFMNFPHLEEYSMSILFVKHPTKPHHWKHAGRTDDIINLKSGFSFNPVLHEQLITTHATVKHCVVVGSGRDMLAAIIELHADYYGMKEQDIILALSSRIDRANKYSDFAGQLRKDCIIFAKKEKPFVLAGNGTVQRKTTTKIYENETDRLYASVKSEGVKV